MGPLLAGPSVRPGEKPPVLRADATQHTPTGALFFGGYYFKAYDWSIATSDTYLLDQVSLSVCSSCQDVIKAIHGVQRKHQVLQGGRIEVVGSQLVVGQTYDIRADEVVKVHTHQDAYTLTSAGHAKTVGKSEDTSSLVFVAWRAGSWKVVEVTAP
jgi:hypothetical protein